MPRDRAGTFDPKLITKYQRRFPDFDDKIFSMYARVMSVREIRGHLEELYGIDVSPDLISAITDAVLEEVAEWQTFVVQDFGTRIQYPANIFVPAGRPGKGFGPKFKSADGRAELSIYSIRNDAGETPATYLRHNLRMDRSSLDYTRIARSFFAISSERDGVILYSRCNFSQGRRAIHCFDLLYPQEEKRSWDAIVTRISLSLRPLEG